MNIVDTTEGKNIDGNGNMFKIARTVIERAPGYEAYTKQKKTYIVNKATELYKLCYDDESKFPKNLDDWTNEHLELLRHLAGQCYISLVNGSPLVVYNNESIMRCFCGKPLKQGFVVYNLRNARFIYVGKKCMTELVYNENGEQIVPIYNFDNEKIDADKFTEIIDEAESKLQEDNSYKLISSQLMRNDFIIKKFVNEIYNKLPKDERNTFKEMIKDYYTKEGKLNTYHLDRMIYRFNASRLEEINDDIKSLTNGGGGCLYKICSELNKYGLIVFTPSINMDMTNTMSCSAHYKFNLSAINYVKAKASKSLTSYEKYKSVMDINCEEINEVFVDNSWRWITTVTEWCLAKYTPDDDNYLSLLVTLIYCSKSDILEALNSGFHGYRMKTGKTLENLFIEFMRFISSLIEVAKAEGDLQDLSQLRKVYNAIVDTNYYKNKILSTNNVKKKVRQSSRHRQRLNVDCECTLIPKKKKGKTNEKNHK